MFIGNKCVNVHTINIDCAYTHDKCFYALHDDGWLWHRRLGYTSVDLISKFSKMIWLKVFQKSVFKKIEFLKLANLENK